MQDRSSLAAGPSRMGEVGSRAMIVINLAGMLACVISLVVAVAISDKLVCSLLHSRHQDAQKFSTTMEPRIFSRLTVSDPSIADSENNGAALPGSGDAIALGSWVSP